MIPFWRLSEAGEDSLGPACSDDGLRLGRTPLIERRDERFAVRERGEIERLLKRAYGMEVAVNRIMPGLSTVAAALNADDQCLARIAAVHLRIPDLPATAHEARWRQTISSSLDHSDARVRAAAGAYLVNSMPGRVIPILREIEEKEDANSAHFTAHWAVLEWDLKQKASGQK